MPTLKEVILTWLTNSPHPEEDFSAKEIAEKLGVNRRSVRVYLAELFKEGLIDRPKHGYYRSKPYYTVGESDWRKLRVQNLHFWVDDYEIRFEDRDREEIIEFPEVTKVGESARIRIEFGWKRSKLHWYVKADAGLDYYSLNLAHLLVNERLLRLGYRPPVEWRAEGFEFMMDLFKYRLNGASCHTFTGVRGIMEKFYDKGYGTRHELSVSNEESGSINDIMAMMQGGVNYGQTNQAIFTLVQESRKILADNGRLWSEVSQTNILLKAIINKLSKS